MSLVLGSLKLYLRIHRTLVPGFVLRNSTQLWLNGIANALEISIYPLLRLSRWIPQFWKTMNANFLFFDVYCHTKCTMPIEDLVIQLTNVFCHLSHILQRTDFTPYSRRTDQKFIHALSCRPNQPGSYFRQTGTTYPRKDFRERKLPNR